MKRTVRELIDKNNFSIRETIPANCPATEAALRLALSGDGALLVVKNGKVRGIVSERDILNLFCQGNLRRLTETPVEDLMSRDLMAVESTATLEQCLMVMTRMKIRHLPVVDRGEIVCVLNMPQISAILVEEKEFMIGELVKYISGSPFQAKDAKADPEIHRLTLAN